jgi:hypothetical protein
MYISSHAVKKTQTLTTHNLSAQSRKCFGKKKVHFKLIMKTTVHCYVEIKPSINIIFFVHLLNHLQQFKLFVTTQQLEQEIRKKCKKMVNHQCTCTIQLNTKEVKLLKSKRVLSLFFNSSVNATR